MQAAERMALVPFRVSGAAADQTLEHRLFQIGQHTLRIDQDVHKSSSLQNVGMKHTFDASSGEEKLKIAECGAIWQAFSADLQTQTGVVNI